LAKDVRAISRSSPSTRQKIKYRNRSDTLGSCPTSDHRWSAPLPGVLAPNKARLAEAREAQTTAEQEARTAREQAAAAGRERDEAVAAAQSRAAEAESRAGEAGAELQRPGADRDEAGGQPARQQPQSTTRRSRHPRQR